MKNLGMVLVVLLVLTFGLPSVPTASGDMLYNAGQLVNLVGESTTGAIATFYLVDPGTGNKAAFSIPAGKTFLVKRVQVKFKPASSLTTSKFFLRFWAGTTNPLGFYDILFSGEPMTGTPISATEELSTPWPTRVKFMAALYDANTSAKIANPGYLVVRVTGFLYPWP